MRGNDLYKALDSPVRREIIELLKWSALSAGDIAAHFHISAPSISRHLDVLKQAGIVAVERRGTTLIYSLNLTVMQEAALMIWGLLGVGGGKAEEHASTATKEGGELHVT